LRIETDRLAFGRRFPCGTPPRDRSDYPDFSEHLSTENHQRSGTLLDF